ncbi:uncharacterized protein LY79DRAFT_671083 [Colletotrichum navitas]|uniref:Polyketide synthase n=1 Tax=Colletotrichum navitas TaxID=681940 RepID=A0AAD8PVY5_9PEZI|nr:uncharacterized protein LY79DRAFT_671083 [Colletotrichum navitas]KAK1585492.1 hypothetical protein LY79DRAFT_671083 [Colletotrichum navitas]
MLSRDDRSSMDPAPDPIVIVGSACRFAGDVNSPSKLWELLQNPRDVRSEITGNRFNAEGFHHPNSAQHGRMNVLHSYLMNNDLQAFDAEFFAINPVEAVAMDPQQRLLLEIVYEAIESAGMTIQGLRGSDTGVYAGLMCGDYEAMLLRDLDQVPTYLAVGTSRAVLSNRVSYFFDWHGASVTIDTACSSSLVAVHQAVRALRAGDSRMAVACGSNLILGPEMYIIESKLKMLSPDGLGRMWDAEANGYARGDGVAAVVIKTLSQALRDGDRIEAVIRETGVNQDGATPGLTMPSASAQRDLIRSVYRKAGLDPANPANRPQYIEAHGTGTPAGDPVEAEALSTAFFGDGHGGQAGDGSPLYVGSIKTVLGHTEGTAGIAGLLKVTKALQNATVPPNMLFERLSPAVAPFYGNLQITTKALAWPEVPDGQPRRASVNNFGFGGTNAHAIVESYQGPTREGGRGVDSETDWEVLVPFVFSAASEDSLRANLAAYVAYFDAHPEVNVHDLGYTLRERRSVFNHRVSFSAATVGDLKGKIQARLAATSSEQQNIGVRTYAAVPSSSPSSSSSTTKNTPSRVLGVFTGQGAQYSRMGAELIEKSPLASRIIQTLESHLNALPEEDRPCWSLRAELLAEPSASRVGEAAISQPLCTAVQIMLVDLLRSANVSFEAVVGHSSGEMAAAYAAGFLSARDAVVIAHYRGLHSKHARSPNGDGIKGAMLAVGTSPEDAAELCGVDEFAGRISLAAVNSPSSVTISGDEDAVAELALVLDDENKFNRRLRVDRAYHSRHMLPCFEPYVAALRRAGVKALAGNGRCTWFSSTWGGKPVDPSADKLSDVYWAENLTRPVAFSDAVAAAAAAVFSRDGGVPGVALEVGPHPALASVAKENMQDVAYFGTLSRGESAVMAFSDCLGNLWERLASGSVDLGGCGAALSGLGGRPFAVLGDLPSYQWKHKVKYWSESRRSRNIRLRHQPHHELLGHACPDSAPHVLRWTNVLKPSEMPWLEGHQVQGQIVLPAAAYVSTAIEAARFLAGGGEEGIRLVELADFNIHNAVTFDQNDTGVEVHVELSRISVKPGREATAFFTYSAALGGVGSADLVLAADGELRVSLRKVKKEEEKEDDKGVKAAAPCLPERAPPPPHMIPVAPDRLYGFMAGLEYDFSGPFRSLVELERKLGRASCVARKARTSASVCDDRLLLHPVDLDAAFQSVMLAHSYPGDDRLRLLHLPSRINKVRVDLDALTAEDYVEADSMLVDSVCDSADSTSGFSGSVSLYAPRGKLILPRAAVQVDEVWFKPVGAMDAGNDRDVFYKMHWVPSRPDGAEAAAGVPVTDRDRELVFVLSRIAAFYSRRFDEMIPDDHLARSESPLCHYLRYARHMTGLLRRGEHRWASPEWLDDTEQDVLDYINEKGFMDNSDVAIMLLVGKTMPRVFRGETTMLEHFRTSGLLDEYYVNGFGTKQSAMWVGGVVKQLTDRNAHLNILEIGAGTGSATKNILGAVGRDFATYTFTDISSSFFESAAETFAPGGPDGGFREGAYDVVVAFMVIHACAKLDEAVANLRKLLRPGGLLILGEGASNGAMQAGAGFIFGPLPGWWRGVAEGRTLSPLVDADEWETILRRNGFSGIDTMSPPRLFDAFGITLFVSTAVDDRVEFARNPLDVISSSSSTSIVYEKVVIVGGQTPAVADLTRSLEKLLTPLAKQVIMSDSVESLDEVVFGGDAGLTVVSLADLERPVFKDMTPERWNNFRQLFVGGNSILWLTSGRLNREPYCNMTVGFGRSAMHEEDTLRVQYVDLEDGVGGAGGIDAHAIVDHLLRFTSEQLDDAEDLLYVKEPEIIIDGSGRELVPRLFPIADANDRLNSASRPIYRQIDTRKSPVELVLQPTGHGGPSLRQLTRYETSADLVPTPPCSSGDSETVQLRLTHAVASALRCPAGFRFLVVGVDDHGSRRLALVSSLTSVIKVPAESAVTCDVPSGSEATRLALVAAELVAMAILSPLSAGQRLVLHNAPEPVAQAIMAQAALGGVIATLLTDSTAPAPASSATPQIELPAYLGRSEMARLLPADVACFASFSNTDEKPENELAILSLLPPFCRRENARTLYSPCGVESGSAGPVLRQLLRRAIHLVETKNAERGNSYFSPPPETMSLEALTNGGHPPSSPLAIIDWTTLASTSLVAQVTRFESKPLFKHDKTYWLVGLSGALGISLCDWMIQRGVRHLVLTSRNPKIDPRWISDHASGGVTIKILSCDVTDKEAIRAVHQTIVDSLPPIVGLLNGAMVLRDVSVRNMKFDQVTEVIGPKVLGSMNLDDIFRDVDLDFFVLLSSINCVIGNVGQANYAAANMGMIGVAGRRRERGLRASVVNVGAIIGVGYITQSDRQLDLTVAKTAMMHLSEQDFHQIFAECVESGHLDNPNGPEISTGLLPITPGMQNIPPWYSDPKFSRFRVCESQADDGSGGGGRGKQDKTSLASVRDLLQACRSPQNVLDVVKHAFGAQLRRMLQVSADDDELMMMRGAELGFDSLLSVDVRSWFLKTFQVSVPVLKIMASDVRMSSLVELAAESIPPELVPQVQQEDASDSSLPSSSSVPSSPRNQDSGGSSSDSVTSSLGASGVTTPTSTGPDLDSKVDSSSSSPTIDWVAETTPPEPDTCVPDLSSAPAPKANPQVVLLTGCAGLLGHHLLNALLAQPSIRKVICVGVRRLSERLGSGRLPSAGGRVVYHEGDLSLPHFGLDRGDWAAIFGEVDAVIHNGSDTSHLKYYSALREANVQSTRQLVSACLPRSVPFHYISSAGVALFAGLDAFPPTSCTGTGKTPPADGSHGYMCGKWACEKMLERLVTAQVQDGRRAPLRVVIQRPSTIIRAGADARVNEAGLDWVNAMLHYAHKTQTVPDIKHNAGSFDLVSVETCCDDVTGELFRHAGSSESHGDITYVNNVGDVVIPMASMADIGLEMTGKAYEVLPMHEWLRRAVATGMHPGVAALIESFDEPGVSKYPALLRTSKA